MLKKILTTAVILYSTLGFTVSAANIWDNEVSAEKGKYTFSSYINNSKNKFEYTCSVLKFDSSNFGKTESITLNLDLKLEEDKLDFQENYNVSLRFSNGKSFSNKLSLSTGKKGLDQFTLFMNSKKDKNDRSIITNLSNRSYVNAEVSDKTGKRVLYRFYLKNSFKSIKETQNNCNSLYETFK